MPVAAGAATTSAQVRTSTLGVAAIRWTRYCDMVSSSPAARTTITTLRAYRARFSTAWPAELAAPTT